MNIRDREKGNYGGTFDTKTEAAAAADQLQVRLRGMNRSSPSLNFRRQFGFYQAQPSLSGSASAPNAPPTAHTVTGAP